MAITYGVVSRQAFGDLFVRLVDLTFGGSDYVAGGYTLDPKSVGLGANGTIIAVIPLGAGGGFLYEWNRATGKLMVRDSSGSVGAVTPEVANSLAALNGKIVTCLVLGRGQG